MPPGGAPAAAGPAGGAELPAFFEYAAPRDWKAIDFISDLHLCEALPRTFDAWAAHLRHTPADAVFILGDLFEVWVGDDARTLPFERRCAEVMAEAASHRSLAFMAGNRDFLLGTAMLRVTGMMGLPDPTVLDAWGQRVLLSHGDELCLDDRPYQAFRAEVRSNTWQQQFLAKPLPQRLAVAAEIRRESGARRRFDGDASADIDAAAAVRWMHAMGAAELVHGHTHRPGSNALAPGFKRHVLSDWDLDQGRRAEVLRLTRSGFQRVAPAVP
ncbi:MAG: UDP-2,3-diacylglucosamine diphosphatase [Betaproteobacteria bacterium]|jgi:UDP-2,3-diacylglucosamine hydrolase|nr:UDP-2,3-diacylglucosamine diphosphatase [Betaproteobacteria bacterium]